MKIHDLLKIASLSFSLLFVSGPALADYATGQKAFVQRNYPVAAMHFFQSYNYPKEPGEKIKSEWGLAQSLEKSGLFFSASKYYSLIVRRGHIAANPFFRNALEQIGRINSTISLGQSHIVQLFQVKVDPASIPGPARGFYFHYIGIEAFNAGKHDQAQEYFERVPVDSEYYPQSLFYMGVVANLRQEAGRAIGHFERVIQFAQREDNQWLLEQATLNIARVHYEAKRYRESLQYYAEIPRTSENWLQALFEASWAFFLMQKHNNVLGNIHTLHSPFFEDRFLPESFILKSITYLRLCRISESREALVDFKARYAETYSEIKEILEKFRGDPDGFYKLLYEYRIGTLRQYRHSEPILDALSRNDAYREAGKTVRFADKEIARLGQFSGVWGQVGLIDELTDFLNRKKSAAVNDAGRRLYVQGRKQLEYLKDLSDQTHLINAEIQLKRVDILREKLNVGTSDKKGDFIGGMQPLKVTQDLEYWPFRGEYWEDELGGYVYNLESKCGQDDSKAKGGDNSEK
jgi:tetratricopeptide (TPR) repeat protein